MKKAIVYIDGRNLFHSLESNDIDAYNYNYQALVQRVINNREIVTVKYYCAHYPAELSTEKNNRDHAHYQELKKQGFKIQLGKFKIRSAGAQKVALEKGVDVLLATDIIFDAFYASQSSAEDFYVFSSDTDLIPAILKVRKQFPKIRIFACQFKTNSAWQKSCNGIVHLHVNTAKKFSNHPVQPTKKTLEALLDKFRK